MYVARRVPLPDGAVHKCNWLGAVHKCNWLTDVTLQFGCALNQSLSYSVNNMNKAEYAVLLCRGT